MAFTLVAGAFIATTERPAAAAPSLQMPFPCGQTWHANRYPGHVNNAIDWFVFPATGGQTVVAAAAGTATARANSGYGNYVDIDHGGGQVTRYAHLRSAGASGTVSQGQVIGRVGTTGNSTANHLHFEYLVNGVGQSNIVMGGVSIAPGTTPDAVPTNPSYTSTNGCSTTAPQPPPPAPAITTTWSVPSAGPVSTALESSGRRDVFTATPAGNVHWSWWNGGTWSTGQIATVGEKITELTSVLRVGGYISVFIGTQSGLVYETWYQPGGGWTTGLIGDLGSEITGLASEAVRTSNYEQMSVFAGTASGLAYEVWWTTSSTSWQSKQIASTSGDPITAIASLRHDGATSVFMSTAGGVLYETWWQPGAPNWTSGAVTVWTGKSLTSVTALLRGAATTVYVGTTTGEIYEAWWYPGLTAWGTGQPTTFSSSSVTTTTGLVNSSGQVDIFAGTTAGTVKNTWWSTPNPTWGNGQIANFSNDLLGLSSMALPGGVEVVYGLTDADEVVEAWYIPGNAWQSQVLTTVS